MKSPKYIGRFAPSPTGPLHQGSLVAAVASYLDARANNGKWHLRIEDVDETRCKPEFAHDIVATLATFGFRWDGEIETQSMRKPHYTAALEKLEQQRFTYACTCSRKEIADSGVVGIEGVVYPGTCRHRGHTRQRNAIRAITNDAPIAFDDAVQGAQSQRLESMIGDFVLKRRDGLFSYQLAVVVDDAALGVTDIVRGADLLDSTPRQIYLQRLLGLPTPRYLHIPVLTNADGQKLSKQTLAPSIGTHDVAQSLRAALAFLHQPDVDASLTEGTSILRRAAEQWRRDAIPASRTSRGAEPDTEA
jgi:glutamyl-Q tRNA(Asp) synthetase